MSRYILLYISMLLFACGGVPDRVGLQVPAAAGSGEPSLFSTKDQLYLTWQEHGDTSRLMLSKLTDGQWSPPVIVYEGSDWFVNWADFPSLASLNNEVLLTHVLRKNGEGLFAYGVNLLLSADGGKTWSTPFIPHETQTRTEHGFVSITPFQDSFYTAWLDGRNMSAEHHGKSGMTLRGAFVSREGVVSNEMLLDSLTCDCCQTDIATSGDHMYLVYRDRSPEEIRDIAMIRYSNGRWTSPEIIHQDNWTIRGCPVNGPAVDALAGSVVVAWFTGADNNPACKFMISTDAGKSFSDPMVIRSGNVLGRVDVKLMSESTAVVTWLEVINDDTYIMLAKTDGTKKVRSDTLARVSGSRATGFPRMAVCKEDIYLVWRDVGDDTRIRSKRISNF